MSEIKEFENRRWREGDQKPVFRHAETIEMIEKGERILDIACGDGLLLQELKGKGAIVAGVDISDEAIKKCREKGLDVSLVDIASEKLPFKNGAFDTVIMLDVLEHLYFPEKLLEEAVRTSKKHIIISVPNFNSLPARLQVLFGGVPENNRPHKGHVFWFNYENLMGMLKHSNLQVSIIKTNTIFENYILIGACTRFLAKMFPSLFALSFVMKVVK
ncbi:MAG: methionine biosynthesis protein MetW [bacterium]|nr:methionine biosynthesis protein MetW [bacterium]